MRENAIAPLEPRWAVRMLPRDQDRRVEQHSRHRGCRSRPAETAHTRSELDDDEGDVVVWAVLMGWEVGEEGVG